MKKISYLKNEKIEHKVVFSKKILLITLLLYVPIIIKTIFDIKRILTHRIYITNQRLIIVKGYIFKRFYTYHLSDIMQVFVEARKRTKINPMYSVKCILNSNKTITLRYIRFGYDVAYILTRNKQL